MAFGRRAAHALGLAATTLDARRQFSAERAPSEVCWLDTRTGAVSPMTEGPYRDERPAATPDGRGVVFVSTRSGRLNLWRVEADGSGVTQLTDGPGPDYRPCVSPDDRLIAYFTSASDGSHQVRVRDLASGKELPTDCTERFAWSRGPFWCNEGRALLVHALERGAAAPALWRVDLSSGEVQRLETPTLAGASHGTVDAAERGPECDARQR